MPEGSGRIKESKVWAFSVDERVFGDLKNRSGTILGRNIKTMISS